MYRRKATIYMPCHRYENLLSEYIGIAAGIINSPSARLQYHKILASWRVAFSSVMWPSDNIEISARQCLSPNARGEIRRVSKLSAYGDAGVRIIEIWSRRRPSDASVPSVALHRDRRNAGDAIRSSWHHRQKSTNVANRANDSIVPFGAKGELHSESLGKRVKHQRKSLLPDWHASSTARRPTYAWRRAQPEKSCAQASAIASNISVCGEISIKREGSMPEALAHHPIKNTRAQSSPFILSAR